MSRRMASVLGLKFQLGARYPVGRTPVRAVSSVIARARSARSTESGRVVLSSWIQPCTPNSWRPAALMSAAMDGVSARLTDGMKKEAGMRCRSRRRRIRPSPARAPYSPMERAPTVGSP